MLRKRGDGSSGGEAVACPAGGRLQADCTASARTIAHSSRPVPGRGCAGAKRDAEVTGEESSLTPRRYEAPLAWSTPGLAQPTLSSSSLSKFRTPHASSEEPMNRSEER